MCLRYIGAYLQDYTVSQPRRPQSEPQNEPFKTMSLSRAVVFHLGYAKTSKGARKIKKYVYYFMMNTLINN
jgi:hypothetical protein